MEHNTQKQKIHERVLAAIKSGEVRMRPKWHFVLKTTLIVTGGIIALLAALYLVSFVIFVLHETGAWFVPSFGMRGLGTFFAAVPVLLLVISLVFIAVVEILARRYSFAYRQPLLYSALGVIALVVIGGFVLAETPLHRGLLRQAREDRFPVPVVGRFYRSFGEKQLERIHPGVFVSSTDSGLLMRSHDGELWEVIVTPETFFPFGREFTEDDQIVVFGERASGTVRAFGIREADESVDWRMNRRPGDMRRSPFQLPPSR